MDKQNEISQVTYLGAKQNIVCAFHTQHETVVLVAHFISVAAEPASAPNLVLLQPGQSVYKHPLPTHARGGVAVFQPPADMHATLSPSNRQGS